MEYLTDARVRVKNKRKINNPVVLFMIPDEIRDLADEISKTGYDWLNKTKEVTEAIQFVEKIVQYSEQFSQSFQAVPSNSDMSGWEPVKTVLEQTQRVLVAERFTMMDGAMSTAVSGAALITAAGSHATGLASSVMGSGDPAMQSWALKSFGGFQLLQTSNDNIGFIKKGLAILHETDESKFEVALKEYSKSLAEATAPSSAAIAMRNVIEALNGSIQQLASNYTGNLHVQKWKWTSAASVVARGGPTSIQAQQLILQGVVYHSLHDTLSGIAKCKWEPNKLDWESLYAQFIGFLFAVIGLIDFRDAW